MILAVRLFSEGNLDCRFISPIGAHSNRKTGPKIGRAKASSPTKPKPKLRLLQLQAGDADCRILLIPFRGNVLERNLKIAALAASNGFRPRA
jgi:hypothetical protein